ncbi:MAG: outer membrane beta-barrel protein [Cellvibrionaceae bacterium]
MLLFSIAAHAEPIWYMKGKLGSTSADAEVGLDLFGRNYDISDEDIVWGLTTGVKVTDYIALELGYTDYNEFGGSYSSPETDPFTSNNYTVTGNANGELSAVAFSAVGILPVSDSFSLYGSLGLANWELNFRDDFISNNPAALGFGSIRGSDRGTDLVMGLGAMVHLSDYVALGIEYERFDVDSSMGFLDVDIGLNSVSATVVLRL